MQGWDLSLNHGAVVQLRNGMLDSYAYATDRIGVASVDRARGACIRMPKSEGKTIWRLGWWRRWLMDVIEETSPHYVAIEDYAYDQPQGAHQLGEIGGLARLMAWDADLPLRTYDPKGIKLFAAHFGDASKDDMMDAVVARWPALPIRSFCVGTDMRTAEDLADAMSVAQLLWLEIRLRLGQVSLEDLDPKEVQTFTRLTEKHPENLLSREFAWRPAVVGCP